MSTAILKRSLGDAGAAIDESHGAPNILRQVLQALAEDGVQHSVYQATIATATLFSMIVDKATILRNFRAAAATTGTANDTDVEVQVNGVAVAATQLTIDNTEANGTKKNSGDLTTALAAGDLVEIVVTAAPTGGAGLTASMRLGGVTVED
jgi:hypothetical protein